MNYLRLYEMDVVLDFLLIVLQLKLLAGLEPLLDELVLSLAPESYELMQVHSLITNYKISAEQHISRPPDASATAFLKQYSAFTWYILRI